MLEAPFPFAPLVAFALSAFGPSVFLVSLVFPWPPFEPPRLVNRAPSSFTGATGSLSKATGTFKRPQGTLTGAIAAATGTYKESEPEEGREEAKAEARSRGIEPSPPRNRL